LLVNRERLAEKKRLEARTCRDGDWLGHDEPLVKCR